MKKLTNKTLSTILIIMGSLIMGLGIYNTNQFNPNEIINESQISIALELKIINEPDEPCQFIETDKLYLYLTLYDERDKGEIFRIPKKYINLSYSDTQQGLILQGSYSNIKNFIKDAYKGEDLTKYLNKVKISILVNEPCAIDLYYKEQGKSKKKSPSLENNNNEGKPV